MFIINFIFYYCILFLQYFNFVFFFIIILIILYIIYYYINPLIKFVSDILALRKLSIMCFKKVNNYILLLNFTNYFQFDLFQEVLRYQSSKTHTYFSFLFLYLYFLSIRGAPQINLIFSQRFYIDFIVVPLAFKKIGKNIQILVSIQELYDQLKNKYIYHKTFTNSFLQFFVSETNVHNVKSVMQPRDILNNSLDFIEICIQIGFVCRLPKQIFKLLFRNVLDL